MITKGLVATSILCSLSFTPAAHGAKQTPTAGQASCSPAGGLVRIPNVSEASGVASSVRWPGHVWVHNDSGDPVVTALDARGAVAGHVQLTGVTVEDWEAIAVGPCSGGSCIYVADIGDNAATRDSIAIHRATEPSKPGESVQVAETFHATYPDGAHDAETFLVAPDGGMFIVTKGETGPVALYGFPKDMRSGTPTRLERIGQPRDSEPATSDRITDGAVSPDGQWVALRSNASLIFYKTSDLFSGRWREAKRIDLAPLREPQGEGVALAPGDVVYLVGESGGRGRGGTFARFVCTPGP